MQREPCAPAFFFGVDHVRHEHAEAERRHIAAGFDAAVQGEAMLLTVLMAPAPHTLRRESS